MGAGAAALVGGLAWRALHGSQLVDSGSPAAPLETRARAAAPPQPAPLGSASAASVPAPSGYATSVPAGGPADADPALATLEREDPQGERVDHDIDKVLDWLSRTPGGVQALESWIVGQNGRYDTGAAWPRIALAALGACELHEARGALRALATRRELSPALRLHAVMHLGRKSGLAASDVEVLTALAAEREPTPGARSSMVASGALSTLGSIAREGRLDDPGLREGALATVRTALLTETEPAYLAAAVNGAAASGDATLLPALEPLAGHANHDVRAALATGLDQVAGGVDASWAVDWAHRETAAQVRASLARAAAASAARANAAPAEPWATWAIEALPRERGTAATALIAVVGAAAHAGSAPARDALLTRFAAERRLGAKADAAVLRELGRHLDATTLAATLAAGSHP